MLSFLPTACPLRKNSLLLVANLTFVTKVLGMISGRGARVPILHLPMRNLPVLELIDETSKRLYVPPPMWVVPELSRAGSPSNLGENRRAVALETQLLVAQDITPVFVIAGASKPHVSDAEDAERTLLVNHQEITLLLMQILALVPLGQLSYEVIGKLQELLQAHVLWVDQSLDRTFERL